MAAWNHNIAYHSAVLRAVPSGCRRLLDVGCGRGELTRKLATRCGQTTGMDLDEDSVIAVQADAADPHNVTFLRGDVMTHPFEEANFDMVVAVAALHHLPLEPALRRFRAMVAPGGVLFVVGIYREATWPDHIVAAAALPLSRTIRMLRGEAEVGAPLHEPATTLTEIRAVSNAVLPGSRVRRRLFFRYTLTWTKV